MKQTAAKIISFVFNPFLFVSLVPYLIVIKETGSNWVAIKWGVFSGAFITIGLLLLIFGRKKGVFSDLDLSKREERSKFYLLLWPILIVYVLLSFVFRGIFFSLSIASVGIVFGLIIFELVNMRLKASIHISVLAAFSVTVGILFGVQLFLWLCLLTVIVAWSRVILKRHTIQEVVVGGILGSSIAFVTFFLGQFLLQHRL